MDHHREFATIHASQAMAYRENEKENSERRRWRVLVGKEKKRTRKEKEKVWGISWMQRIGTFAGPYGKGYGGIPPTKSEGKGEGFKGMWNHSPTR